MRDNCVTLRRAAALAASVLLVGCSDLQQLANELRGSDLSSPTLTLAELVDRLSPEVTDQQLAELLPAALENPVAAVIEPNFGESAALYETAAFEEIPDEPNEPLLDGVAIARGRLAGEFVNDLPDSDSFSSPGTFRGRWFSAGGRVEGLLRGEYQPLRPEDVPPGLTGAGVFYGRYIDSTGRLRGVLRGRYGRSEGGEGMFFGRWHDRHDRLLGLMRGRWMDRPETGGGRFDGHWAAFDICREVDGLDGAAAADSGPDLDAALEELVARAPDPEAVFEANPIAFDPNEPAVEAEEDVYLQGGPPCADPRRPHGFLRGWHRPLRDDPNRPDVHEGVLRARWHSANGRISGHLFGHYVARVDLEEAVAPAEQADADSLAPRDAEPLESQAGDEPAVRRIGVFHARYRSDSGRIHGHIRGEFGRTADGVGVFRGRYFNDAGEPRGVVRGRWDEAPDRPGGPLFGIWVGADFGEQDPEDAEGGRGLSELPQHERG